MDEYSIRGSNADLFEDGNLEGQQEPEPQIQVPGLDLDIGNEDNRQVAIPYERMLSPD